MAQFARALTNKLVHTPCIQMKKASSEGRAELMDWAQELLGLDDSHKDEH
jgi:glutamyl-tRNA reductase